jgi:hypothetical protein
MLVSGLRETAGALTHKINGERNKNLQGSVQMVAISMSATASSIFNTLQRKVSKNSAYAGYLCPPKVRFSAYPII